MDEARVLEDYSYEDYLDIDRSTQERVELIFGNIYMMAEASALHQDIVLSIAHLLKNLSKAKQKYLPRIAPFDLKLSVDDRINVVQPDVMLFCDEEKPCAIFEIMSPSTALKDKTIKKELYEQSEILEYFLVNTEYKVIDKFTLVDGCYEYAGAFGDEDALPIACIDGTITLDEVFEG